MQKLCESVPILLENQIHIPTPDSKFLHFRIQSWNPACEPPHKHMNARKKCADMLWKRFSIFQRDFPPSALEPVHLVWIPSFAPALSIKKYVPFSPTNNYYQARVSQNPRLRRRRQSQADNRTKKEAIPNRNVRNFGSYHTPRFPPRVELLDFWHNLSLSCNNDTYTHVTLEPL